MNKKTKYGQFFTTNYEYILQGLKIPSREKIIIEPFSGNGDLLHIVKKSTKILCYDIDPKVANCSKRDTLKSPPIYRDTFIITNPPYLAMNKNKNKSIYNKYNEDDLYKCFIRSILEPHNIANGGIIIVPLNFWCSIREGDSFLRRDFMNIYKIGRINIFEEQVFDDTSYTVCSFIFYKKTIPSLDSQLIPSYIYPSEKIINLNFSQELKWLIGGEIYQLPISDKYTVTRDIKPNTHIHIYAIDSGSKNNKIRLIYDKKKLYIDQSSRTRATLHIIPKLNEENQKHLVILVNEYLQKQRQKYHSLFLTNYRESKEYARKRISFDLVYRICNWFLTQEAT
jgi:hypothetical protein